MKVSELFPRKSPAPRKRSGATELEAAQLKEFRETFGPVAAKAKQYFVAPVINNKQRFWLLTSEDYDDLPADKIVYVLKYKTWFLNEISKVELDAIPYDYPTIPDNETAQHISESRDGMGAQDCGGSCSR